MIEMNFFQKLLIPERDKLRHKILEFVFNKAYGSPNRVVHEEDIAIPVKEISEQLNLPEHEVHYAGLSLQQDEIKFCEYNKEICVVADKDTFSAFTSQKYLHLGRQKRVSAIKDYLGIAVALIAIVSAIYTATVATKQSNNSTQQQIETLKIEVRQLKDQLNQSNHQ